MINGFSHNRRRVLGSGAALAVASFFGTSSKAFATLDDVEKIIGEFTAGTDIGEGKITLSIPEIAENGDTVPVSIVVDSPMSEDDYVESVMIVAEGNPLPQIATMNFTPMSGRAEVSTRMRLAQTQDVMAVARMSDGSFFKDVRNVKVTISGCDHQ